MMEFISVGVGGFLGSCLRYALTRMLPHTFPMGTLFSNIIAGLFIGFIIGAEQNSSLLNPRLKLFLTTGILGGLSTFSTFSLETITFFQNGKYFMAIANICLNLFLSLACVVLGMFLGKLLFSKA